jgi:hypothetical protein
VYLLAAARQIVFLGHRCTSLGCSGKLECDGYEQCMMRMNAKVAFCLELLYYFSDRTADCGVPWHRFWRQTLQRYRGCVRVVSMKQHALWII